MSQFKYVLNDSFSGFENFLINIKDYFNENTSTIHKARNEIKVIEYNNIMLVVKSFKVPNMLNKVVYSYLKDSKAKKSYDNAIKLEQLNINTPKPVGYIEFFEKGMIKESFFVSILFEYDFTIREPLLDKNFVDKEEILSEFGKFTNDLHNKGVFHKDYSPGNILIKKVDDNYVFSIVDINRMEFKELYYEQRLQNFSKLWAKDEDLITIIKSYAKSAGMYERRAVEDALKYSHAHKARINFKKRLKGIKVVD
ncbi:lipopolysaccharide kinase InaA family protein [Arcobacter sp. FWKO B]|uniref:lipopolysaccharide kinase InaA family protein n=1 Tax=Arcobacter sp. FWKO B TaxID=2593672 RepID=UPI0018A4BA33|nr:lipopolysaccharide kinase InaA family protein [Arcobacter sp. FWKO B]QOG11453.1 hypothetical protein FWKOB_01550 [Arcobacter sp. FWKO B]